MTCADIKIRKYCLLDFPVLFVSHMNLRQTFSPSCHAISTSFWIFHYKHKKLSNFAKIHYTVFLSHEEIYI